MREKRIIFNINALLTDLYVTKKRRFSKGNESNSKVKEMNPLQFIFKDEELQQERV